MLYSDCKQVYLPGSSADTKVSIPAAYASVDVNDGRKSSRVAGTDWIVSPSRTDTLHLRDELLMRMHVR